MATHKSPQRPSAPPDEDPALPADPVQTVAPMAHPNKRPQSIPLKTWALAKWGAKHQDQAVPFTRWAEKNAPARASAAEWTALSEKFHSKQVGS